MLHMRQRALFLDRDGTLVHPKPYPSRPEELHLYDEIGPVLRHLQKAGLKLVMITNQSGIARGYFDEIALQRMHTHLATQLAHFDAHFDGIYYCPHHPQGTIPELAIACDCRKPQPGMLLRAAEDLAIDLHLSWFVGDILDDVEAGNRVGCRTVLVDLGTEAQPTTSIRVPDFVARNTLHALELISAIENLSPAVDTHYLPSSWQMVWESTI